MDSLQEFFNMGGYAFYVWTSYGTALVVMLYILIAPILRKKRIEQMLARRLRRKEEHES